MLGLVRGGTVLLVVLATAGGRAPESSPMLARARAFGEFPLYYASERVDGLPLTAVLQRDDTATFVSFVYGDCTPGDDAGCAPPAEIQVWPACRRNLAFYDGSPATGSVATTIRGVPALTLDDGTHLELQTGRSTVVVFADSSTRALRVAQALRSLNGSVPLGASLPQPAPGALEDKPTC
jgi:hypothetical protein